MRLLRLLMRMTALRTVAAILMLAVVGLHLARILALRRVLMLLPLSVAVPLALSVHLLLLLLMLLLALVLSARADHTIIVFGMLVEILRGDPIACGTRIARQREIFFQDLIGVAANADIGTAAVERLGTLRHMRFTAVVTATLTLHVWTGSHNT